MSNTFVRGVFAFGRRWFTRISFFALERLLSKRPAVWCFATWPGSYAHTLDNPRAVFEEVKYDPAITKVILRKPQQDSSSSVVEGVNVVVVDVESVRGAYYLAIAGCLLVGYGLGGVCSYGQLLTRRRKIIQLWHGIPLKRIGKLFPGEKHWDLETPNYAATVCSSSRDQEIMTAAFAPLPVDRVWLTGLPRNRTIRHPEEMLAADHRHDLARLRASLAGRRLALYAPTWRDSEIGIYPFSGAQREALEQVLRKHNAVLGIRAHANRRTGDAYADLLASGSVFFVNDYPDVNVLLRATDVLITDYSSIYIDYMLTDRPILHFTYDIDEYVKERGFLYDLEEAMPSQWFREPSEFISNLDLALGTGEVDEQRYSRAKKLFHSHGADEAAQVVSKIKQLLNS